MTNREKLKNLIDAGDTDSINSLLKLLRRQNFYVDYLDIDKWLDTDENAEVPYKGYEAYLIPSEYEKFEAGASGFAPPDPQKCLVVEEINGYARVIVRERDNDYLYLVNTHYVERI